MLILEGQRMLWTLLHCGGNGRCCVFLLCDEYCILSWLFLALSAHLANGRERRGRFVNVLTESPNMLQAPIGREPEAIPSHSTGKKMFFSLIFHFRDVSFIRRVSNSKSSGKALLREYIFKYTFLFERGSMTMIQAFGSHSVPYAYVRRHYLYLT